MYRFTEVIVQQGIILPVNSVGACDGRQSINESRSLGVPICRYVRNYSVIHSASQSSFGLLSGKLEFGTVGPESRYGRITRVNRRPGR
jgi:hypothetical protein